MWSCGSGGTRTPLNEAYGQTHLNGICDVRHHLNSLTQVVASPLLFDDGLHHKIAQLIPCRKKMRWHRVTLWVPCSDPVMHIDTTSRTHLVDLPCSQIIVPLQLDVQKPFVVAKIQIDLCWQRLQGHHVWQHVHRAEVASQGLSINRTSQ